MFYQSGIDAVVVSYRTPRDLEGFLWAWQTYADEKEHTLHVVNVAPTLEDVQVGLGAGSVHLSYMDNVGYARACNAGAQLGQREVIAFFNADTRITEGLLDACHHALLARAKRGILGPRQIDNKNRLTHAGIFGTPESPRHRAWKARDTGEYSDVRDDAITVSGSAFFIRRSVWDELTACPIYRESHPEAQGAFLPTQFYFEETWAAYHARAHGYLCTYFGPAQMIHTWQGSVQANQAESWATSQYKISQLMFRDACQDHGIAHD